MEVKEEIVQETEMESPVAKENVEMKVPIAKIRVTNADRIFSISPIRKITIRQSSDSPTSPQPNYEIITDVRTENKRQDVTEEALSPTVRLQRYETESPKDKAINNGLDPIGIALISSANLAASELGSEYFDKTDEIHATVKISREMKNLQKSTNESKILSDYLNTSSENPRGRSRKTKEVPLTDPDEEDLDDDEKEVNSCESPAPSLKDVIDSDSEQALPMEPPGSRRKSISHSRNRSRSTFRSIKKSVPAASEDLAVTSDKEDIHGDEEEDQSSEVSFVTNRSLDGRTINPPPKPGWDSFCFKCHTDNAVLSLACSKCRCSYHRHCVRPNPIPKNSEEFECPECRDAEVAQNSSFNKYGHEKIDPNTLADMLTIIVEKIRTYPEREHFENDIVVKSAKDSTQPLIVTQMSLKTLESRIKERVYTTTEAFVHDIKQLEHNWNIVDRSKTKTLKSIVKYVNSEINELEACVYCYETSFITGEWFVQTCKRPHLLIWAKLKGYPYWPAKVMSVDSRQHVDVRFFGAHDRAWVPSSHCILFSEKDPNKTKGSTPTNNKNTSKNQKGIADAMKEKDDYIENLRLKYGFKYAPCRTQFDPTDLQGQLEFMLPGLKDRKDGLNVEIDGAQKEKLTLKIIKGESSNYQVEQKTAEQRSPLSHKQTEKSKPNLYKVLSKTEDNADPEQSGRLKPLIIKRKSNVEQESGKLKKTKTNDNPLETSESNGSVQSGKPASRRKSTRDSGKHKKPSKHVEKESPSDLVPKKNKHGDKQKTLTADAPAETTAKPAGKKTRAKSVLTTVQDKIVSDVNSSSTTTNKRTQKRSQSFERSLSTEKVALRNVKKMRGLSVCASQSQATKRSRSEEVKNDKSISKSKEEEENLGFDPNMRIKDEPVSDSEEVEQRKAFTLSDIPNLIQNKTGKKKLIVISTNDVGEPSTASERARARKTFPNQQSQVQMEAFSSHNKQDQNGDWMVCIPKTFSPNASSSAGQRSNRPSPPASNRSTPASDSHGQQLRSNSNVPRTATAALNNHFSVNRSLNLNVPPLSYNVNSSDTNDRINSVQANPTLFNGQRHHTSSFQQVNNHSENPPRLVPCPRPQGAFVNDGSIFNRDTGPVSRLLTDNAHRMSDFFRTVLLDTVTSFASEVPAAENLILRAENEKLLQEIQTTKTDCQQRMQDLRKEHQEEIETIKKECEERLKNLQNSVEQEKARLISEIRHQCELEKQRAIDITRKETKKNTWCSNCTKEARFYCCWNTSYCSLQCQRNHWQLHQRCCANKNSVNDPVQAIPEPVVSSNPLAPRPALILRSTQQLQQSAAMSGSPPAAVHQHIILPNNNSSSTGTSMMISNAVSVTQPITLSAFHSKFNEHVMIDRPSSLILKTIRHETPNAGLVNLNQLTSNNP